MDRAVPSGQQATVVPRGAESHPRARSKLVNSTYFTAKPGFRLSPVTTRPLGALARAPVGSGPGEWEGGGKLMGSWDSGVVVPPTSWQRRTPPRRRSGGRPHWRPQPRGAAGEEDEWHFGGGSVPKTTEESTVPPSFSLWHAHPRRGAPLPPTAATPAHPTWALWPPTQPPAVAHPRPPPAVGSHSRKRPQSAFAGEGRGGEGTWAPSWP